MSDNKDNKDNEIEVKTTKAAEAAQKADAKLQVAAKAKVKAKAEVKPSPEAKIKGEARVGTKLDAEGKPLLGVDYLIGTEDKKLHYKLRLFIKAEAEGDAFGPGIADLMRGIERHGSLLKAAESMHMAYSKAWKIIHKVECNLGFQLIFRQVGRGCGSTITPDGQKFLTAYDNFIKECEVFAHSNFEKQFKAFLKSED